MIPFGFALFLLGGIAAYVAFRLKLVNFEQYAYIIVGILFVSLLIPSLITSQDIFQSLIQIGIPVTMMFIMVHEGLKYRKKKEQKRRD